MRTRIIIGAFVVLAAVAAWCLISGGTVDQFGVDAVSGATKPKTPSHSGSSSSTTMTAEQKSAAEMTIVEVTYRYMFSNEKAAASKKPEGYYLGLGSAASPKDPPADVVTHFEGNTPPVKAASASKRAADGSVVNKATSKPGLLFRVENVKWVNNTSVEVVGGCTESSKSSTTETFKLALKGKAWQVTEAK